MSRNDPPYPLPVTLASEIEMAMEGFPDRGGAVWRLRDLIGRVYAQGHIDGRIQRMNEERYDRQHDVARSRPPADTDTGRGQ